MKKYGQRTRRQMGKYAVILFFFLFFLYGMSVVRDYGISWDEATERNSCLINLGYIFPQAREIVTDTVNYNGLPLLSEYKYRYYGVAGQFPAILAEYLYQFRFNYQQVYLLRHMYTFCVFFTACIFFYLLCRQLTRRRSFSLLAVFLLVISPRILADSFYNIKDLLFLSFFVIALYFGLLLIRRQNWPRLLAFGFFGGLCTNVRIVGAITVVCCVLAMAWRLRGQWRKKWGWFIGAGLLSFLFFMAFTPIVWQNPIEGIRGILETFSSYTSYTQSIYFMGSYPSSDQLPWYYLPVWILATTPLICLLLMAAGAVYWIGGLPRRMRGLRTDRRTLRPDEAAEAGTTAERLFLAGNLLLPLLYVLLFRPVLYNGWRHFYFIYPLLILAALYGMIHLWNTGVKYLGRRKARAAAAVLLAAGILPVVTWIGLNHPFEYLYFNEIARPWAEQCFEKDYWGVSQYDALQYICETDSSDTIRIWTMTPSENRYLLSYEDQARVEIVSDLSSADYAIYNHTSTRSTEAINQMSLYQPIYTKDIDGMAVYTIYQRIYTPYSSSALQETWTQENGEDQLAAVTAQTGSISWEITCDSSSVTFTGQLADPVSTDRIRLESGSRSDYDYENGDLVLYVSSDGVSWIEPEIQYVWWDTRYDYDFHFDFPAMEVSWIRLVHRLGGVRNQEWNMEVQVLAHRSEAVDSHRDTVIESASASHQAAETAFAYDGNMDTRWSSGIPQEAGMYYEAELKSPIQANEIRLIQAGYRTDFPAALEISVSPDGVSWHTLSYQSEDMETFSFETETIRYIRFQIPEGTQESQTNWSIYELQFYSRQQIIR